MHKLHVLFPSEPTKPGKVDPEFESELASVRMMGGSVGLFDFEALKKERFDLAMSRLPRLNGPVQWVYRGWMMRPELYEKFYNELNERNYKLISKPASYGCTHMYPLAYVYINTRSVLTYSTDGTAIDHNGLIRFFDENNSEINDRRLFVKDWVKSAKGIPGATYISDYTDAAEVNSVCQKLVDASGDTFSRGFVFKKFIDVIKRPDGLDEEYRGFFYKGRMLSWFPAHGPGGMDVRAPEWIGDFVSGLPFEFYTMDFALVGTTEEYEAFIIDVGDGGVSGLSTGQLPISFFSALSARLFDENIHKLIHKDNE